MDVLKQQGKRNKSAKSPFQSSQRTTRGFRTFGPVHITEEEYGTFGGGCYPLTNRYMKSLKQELKREYRAVKRSEKHKLKKQIEQDLLDEI